MRASMPPGNRDQYVELSRYKCSAGASGRRCNVTVLYHQFSLARPVPAPLCVSHYEIFNNISYHFPQIAPMISSDILKSTTWNISSKNITFIK